jgi:digeranylgeranylglycerophospholipid reductase
MRCYDAVIVGAGPAGGQCARLLAKEKKKVLILEKAKDFNVNNYSSGGAPLSIMKTYQLPETIISTYWNKLNLHSSFDSQSWTSSNSRGVVLDFKKLRQFLTDEALENGAEIRLNCSYLHHSSRKDFTLVHLKENDQQTTETLQTRVLIDATGSERNVLAQKTYDKSQALAATGIEYHIEVSSNMYQHYAHALSFFLGNQWMPQGYAWIFPISQNLLKIGVIRYFLHEQIVPHDPSLRHYLEQMIQKNFGLENVLIQAKHGKTLYYTYHQTDLHHRENVIAIGDAISTLNPLASEGIRHAMASADIASKCVLNYLDKNENFNFYPKKMRHYYGKKWVLSEALMQRIYREPNDQKLDLILQTFKKFSFQDLLDLAFEYHSLKALKFYIHYKVLCFFKGL